MALFATLKLPLRSIGSNWLLRRIETIQELWFHYLALKCLGKPFRWRIDHFKIDQSPKFMYSPRAVRLRSKLYFANRQSSISPLKTVLIGTRLCLPWTPSNTLDRGARCQTEMQRELPSHWWFHLPAKLARNIAPLGNTIQWITELKRLHQSLCITMKSVLYSGRPGKANNCISVGIPTGHQERYN